jgi:hypothetical protein
MRIMLPWTSACDVPPVIVVPLIVRPVTMVPLP